MTNETKIKVPKIYEHMVESIKIICDYHCYRVTLHEGYLIEDPWVSSSLTRIFFAHSQKEVLAFIRSARRADYFTVPAPEGTAVKEDTTNVDANNTAVPVEQDHVPSAVAVDAPETAPDSEAAASVVDDQRVAFTNCMHKNHEGYCILHSDGIDYLEPCVEGPCPDECIPELQPP